MVRICALGFVTSEQSASHNCNMTAVEVAQPEEILCMRRHEIQTIAFLGFLFLVSIALGLRAWL